MSMVYQRFFQYWGRGLLLAAIVAAIGGLLLGKSSWTLYLYILAGVFLMIALLFLVLGRKYQINDQSPGEV